MTRPNSGSGISFDFCQNNNKVLKVQCYSGMVFKFHSMHAQNMKCAPEKYICNNLPWRQKFHLQLKIEACTFALLEIMI